MIEISKSHNPIDLVTNRSGVDLVSTKQVVDFVQYSSSIEIITTPVLIELVIAGSRRDIVPTYDIVQDSFQIEDDNNLTTVYNATTQIIDLSSISILLNQLVDLQEASIFSLLKQESTHVEDSSVIFPSLNNLTHVEDSSVVIPSLNNLTHVEDSSVVFPFFNNLTHVIDTTILSPLYNELMRFVEGIRFYDNSVIHTLDSSVQGVSKAESFKVSDFITNDMSLIETSHFSDQDQMFFSRNDRILLTDAKAISETLKSEGLRTVDAFSTTFNGWRVTSSASPDTDKFGDGWAAQDTPSTVHGTATSMLAKGASISPGADERISYFEIDFTGFLGVSSSATPFPPSLAIRCSTSNAVIATTLLCDYAVQATRWFTESLICWNTRPTPTFTALPSLTIAVGATALYTCILSSADLAAMLGKWVVFRFRTAGGAAPDTVTIFTRENATATNRPAFGGTLTIP